MTHDRTQPPNDELMGKVVAKWKGCTCVTLVPSFGIPGFDDGSGGPYYTDPRLDTDAALELLGHVCRIYNGYRYDSTMESFTYSFPALHKHGGSYVKIPISGEGFRRAVCWLAVEVLGVR